MNESCPAYMNESCRTYIYNSKFRTANQYLTCLFCKIHSYTPTTTHTRTHTHTHTPTTTHTRTHTHTPTQTHTYCLTSLLRKRVTRVTNYISHKHNPSNFNTAPPCLIRLFGKRESRTIRVTNLCSWHSFANTKVISSKK